MRDCGGRRQRSDILRRHRQVVENPNVSRRCFRRTKTRTESTPKTIDGLVPNIKDIFFLLSVSFHISNQNANHKVLSLVMRCSNRGTHFLSKCVTATVAKSLQTQFLVSLLLSSKKCRKNPSTLGIVM